MGEQILHRLVAAEHLAPLPGPLDEIGGGRHHELDVDPVAEPREQLAAAVGARLGLEAVEAEAVDEQVRDPPLDGLAGDVAVELHVDHLDLVARERAGIARGRAEAVVVQQELAPDVGGDHREVRPRHPEALGQRELVGADRALARGGRALDVHHHGPVLRREPPEASTLHHRVDPGFDQLADAPAAVAVRDQDARDAAQQRRITDQDVLPGDDARDRGAQRLAGGDLQAVAGLRRPALPAVEMTQRPRL